MSKSLARTVTTSMIGNLFEWYDFALFGYFAAIIGKPDFSNMYVVLRGTVADGTALVDARKVDGAAIFAYGSFITVAINFILLALVIFIMVKAINSLKRKEEAAPSAPPAPTKEQVLLTEIRDLLKSK